MTLSPLLKILFASPLILSSSIVLADPVSTVNIRWNVDIVQWTCTLSSASSDMTVNLGNWSTRNLSSGDTTTPKYFTIKLSGCNSSTVATTFTGNADTTNSNYLKLSSDSTAQNVAIALTDSNHNALPLNKLSSATTVDSDGNVTLGFYANYIVTGDNITAGTANADATFTLTYD